jgi:hypothetical protein
MWWELFYNVLKAGSLAFCAFESQKNSRELRIQIVDIGELEATFQTALELHPLAPQNHVKNY